MDNSVTILVNSCDLYEDAWEPFFRLLHIQWPTCQYPCVLNTETKVYQCDFMNVKTICAGGGQTWSKRIINCLKQIDSDYILFFLEDEFLREKVNTQWFDNTLQYMKEHEDVGVIFVRHSGKQKEHSGEPYIDRHALTDRFPIVGLAALYRKTYFLKLLRKHENPWEFERYGSIRSQRMKEKVLQYSWDYPAMFVFDDEIEKGYGITKRKWLPKNKELFEQYGISVNFERLGWLDTSEKASANDLEPKAISSDQSIREKLHQVKKIIVKMPQKVKKKMRELKSLR